MQALLQQSPRLRLAALKQGGIIWRLVIEHIDVQEVLDSIPEQGSSAALSGMAISNFPAVYNDDLTIEEERIVCGMYDSSTSPGLSFVLSHCCL